MRSFRVILSLLTIVAVTIPIYGYDEAKVNRYIREAEYYTRQAEGYERDAAHYTRQAQKYIKDAEHFSKNGNDSKAKNYMRWAKEASDKASLRKMKARDSRHKAQLRMKWANEEMKRQING